ncbi:hypothetical protein Trydic_g8423 [Trypoxylus dichotomus]
MLKVVLLKLLFTIWMLAKPKSFTSSCGRFGFSKGTGHLFYYEIIRLICAMVRNEICWPTYEEARTTATFFLGKHGFPGIMGAIRISEGNQFIPDNMHLVRDSAYPLIPNVIVPFRDNGHLTRRQLRCNTILSKCRSKIAQAFGRLKGIVSGGD